MDFDYIRDRLDVQMRYYNERANKFRKEYYAISIALLVLNALIPVLSIAIESGGIIKYVIASISALASVLSGVLLIKNTKETWIVYRTTYERLEKEKMLFTTSSGKYAGETAEDFIANCEAIMENEHSFWKELNQKDLQERRK